MKDMKNVKKLFTLFILLISSAIIFNHRSFSRRLTERYFADYQNAEDSHDLQDNDDEIKNNDDLQDDDVNDTATENVKDSHELQDNDDEIKNNDDLQDDDVDDIIAEEERKDEFLMLKVIFLLVFVILILLSLSFCIYLLSDEKKDQGMWKFNQSLEDQCNVGDNNFFDFNNGNPVFLPEDVKYIQKKEELFKKRDYKFYSKINNYLNGIIILEDQPDAVNDVARFYYFFLKVIAPEYSDRRGFPSFFEKKDGSLEFGHSLMNSEKNKLCQMTEDKGSLFVKMSTFLESVSEKENNFLDSFIDELVGILKTNSYLNFDDQFRFFKGEIDNREAEGYILNYLACYDWNNYKDKDDKSKSIIKQMRDEKDSFLMLWRNDLKLINNNEFKLNENDIDNNISDEEAKEDKNNEKANEREKVAQTFFKMTYRKKITDDIKKLIYFLFCRCLMNIIMQEKYPIENFMKLKNFFSKNDINENADEDNNIDNIDNINDSNSNIMNNNNGEIKINNINNIHAAEEEEKYTFELMPRKSSTFNNKDHWEEVLLGKKDGDDLFYEIEIGKKDIYKYLGNVVNFIASYLVRVKYKVQSTKDQETTEELISNNKVG